MNRQPIVDIRLLDQDGMFYLCPVIVDTGFNGWLTLPADIILKLGLIWKDSDRMTLADGTEILCDVFELC